MRLLLLAIAIFVTVKCQQHFSSGYMEQPPVYPSGSRPLSHSPGYQPHSPGYSEGPRPSSYSETAPAPPAYHAVHDGYSEGAAPHATRLSGGRKTATVAPVDAEARAPVAGSTHRHRHRHHHVEAIGDDAGEQYSQQVSDYHRQMQEYRDAVRQRNKQQEDAQLDAYFDRMNQYGMRLSYENYQKTLAGLVKQKQDAEKVLSEARTRFMGESPAAVAASAPVSHSPISPPPRSPFGADDNEVMDSIHRRQHSTHQKVSPLSRQEMSPIQGVTPPPPSAVQPREDSKESHAKAVALQELCAKFLPTVRKHCFPDKIEKAYAVKCRGYFQDCQKFLVDEDPLYNIAHSFDSKVGLNLGTVEVNGIPYYPINEEGSIGVGRQMNIPFGSWGGGYSDHIGVRDYWSQQTEIGANWYEGKYGYKFGWSVPLVQSLGIEGDTHALVSVPLKKGDLGKPIGVDVGGGVGPYYQQNTHVGVDYMNGQVGANLGVGVPMAGVGVNTGWGVKFPSVNDVMG